MKKCPKCGALNKPEATVCNQCLTSLDGVPVVNQQAGPVQPTGGPVRPSGGPLTGGGPLVGGGQTSEEPQTVVGQPLGGYQNQQPSPYVPQSPYGPPPSQPHRLRGEIPRPEPIRKSGVGTTIAVVILILALLGSGGFAAWKYLLKPKTPTDVMRAYMAASAKGDAEAVKKCLSESSLNLPNFEEGLNRGFSLAKSQNKKDIVEGKDFILEEGKIEGDKATVLIKAGPEMDPKDKQEMNSIFPNGLPFILIKEHGKWKIDIMATFMNHELLGPLMKQMQKPGSGMYPGGSPR